MSGCPERHEDLSALLDGALEPDEARALEEHLAGCAGCQAERDALAQVVEQVRGLPRRAAPPFFGAAVMARVLDDASRPVMARVLDDAPRPELPDVVLLVEEPPPPPQAEPATPTSGAPRDPGCAAMADDLSAYVDRELAPEDRQRVDAHLGACPTCDAELWVLDQQRARLRALPRLRPHELFVRQVMSKIEAEELAAADRSRRLSAERAQRVRQVGWVLRAASLLGAAALALQLTAPEGAPPQISLPQPSFDMRTRAFEAAAPRMGAAPAPVDQPPLSGPFDAVLELRAEQALDLAFAAAQELAGAQGRVEALRVVEGQRELKVQVPARLVDDLYRGLDARGELEGSSAAARAADAAAVEQDRVVLKSGVVLAGTIQSDTPAAVVIVTGGLSQRVDRRRIERIERADQPRSVRLVITERP